MADDKESRNPLASTAVIVAVITGLISLVSIMVTGVINQNNTSYQMSLQLTGQAAQALDTATWTARQLQITLIVTPSPTIMTQYAISTNSETATLARTAHVSTNTATILRSVTSTIQATQTASPESLIESNDDREVTSYPCAAQIDPLSISNRLNVVRRLPNLNAPTVGSVVRGQVVLVLERSAGSGSYYLIEYESNSLGWILDSYLVFDEECSGL